MSVEITVEMLDKKINTFLDKLRHYQKHSMLTPQTQEQTMIQRELSEQLMSLRPYLQALRVEHEALELEASPSTNIPDGVGSPQPTHPDFSFNTVIHDLKKIQKYLTTRPKEQLIMRQESPERLNNDLLQKTLAQFSQWGHRSTDHMMFRRPTLCTTFNRLKFIVNTYITQEDQKNEFLHALQSLSSHPEIAPLLHDPLSKFQLNNFQEIE